MTNKNPPPEAVQPDENWLFDLVDRANRGLPKAKAQLQALMEEYPDLWRTTGDLSAHAEMSLIRAIAQGNQFLYDCLIRRTAELHRVLGAETATPLERLAIARLVACWLQVYDTDNLVAQVGNTVQERLCATRQQNSAHRRFESALRMLLFVRHCESAEGRSKGLPRWPAHGPQPQHAVEHELRAEASGAASAADCASGESLAEEEALQSCGPAVNGSMPNGFAGANRLAEFLAAGRRALEAANVSSGVE